ncbi:MAG TPA: hypothetical protein VFA46_08095 [Actinomycetes bacterium]|jgi:hypothetical protein|nr:hypothetical protein [Actinomycetes bacterium]
MAWFAGSGQVALERVIGLVDGGRCAVVAAVAQLAGWDDAPGQ